MSNIDIARAWKDKEYRNSLTPEQLAQLPANPAGEAEEDLETLSDAQLDEVSGGMKPITYKSSVIRGNKCGGC